VEFDIISSSFALGYLVGFRSLFHNFSRKLTPVPFISEAEKGCRVRIAILPTSASASFGEELAELRRRLAGETGSLSEKALQRFEEKLQSGRQL
jgi:hypothetical protein